MNNRSKQPADQTFTVPDAFAGSRLDAFAATMLPNCGQRGAKRLAEHGCLLVNGKSRTAQFKLAAGAEVTILAPKTLPVAETPFLLMADASYAAFAKPAGLHTAYLAGSGGASLESSLRDAWHERYAARPFSAPEKLPLTEQAATIMRVLADMEPGAPALCTADCSPLPQNAPLLLGRLDRATSGIVFAAFTPEAALLFRNQEEAGMIHKYYLAVVHGVPPAFCIQNALDTDNRVKTRVLSALTPDFMRHTEVFPLMDAAPFVPEQPTPCTLVAVRIRRGARHQIRAHLAHAAFPLLGDSLYGSAKQDTLLYLHHARMATPDCSVSLVPSWLNQPVV